MINSRNSFCYLAFFLLSACADNPTTALVDDSHAANQNKCTASEPVTGSLVSHRACSKTEQVDSATLPADAASDKS